MMRYNILAGTIVVPIIARLILCTAFVPAGWNKLMNLHEFHGEAAQQLIAAGIVDVIRPGPRATPDEPARSAQATGDDNGFPEPPPDVIEEDPVTGEQVLVAKRLHGVTLMLLNRGVDRRLSVWLAWILALTELIGGALLLIGLFSRVWALGLTGAMAGAFVTTSAQALMELGGPFGVAADMTGGYAAFHAMFAQMGLLALALIVALVGPGPVSLDRLVFRPRPNDEVTFEDEFVSRPRASAG